MAARRQGPVGASVYCAGISAHLVTGEWVKVAKATGNRWVGQIVEVLIKSELPDRERRSEMTGGHAGFRHYVKLRWADVVGDDTTDQQENTFDTTQYHRCENVPELVPTDVTTFYAACLIEGIVTVWDLDSIQDGQVGVRVSTKTGSER